jgi:hypothetical protein
VDKSLQPTDEKQDKPNRITVAKVDEYYRQAEDWNDLREMMTDTNYYADNQWIGWNKGDKRIILLPIQDANQERITLNKIKPRILTLLAKHTKNKIKFNVVAGSKENKDMDAAKAADKFLKYLWNELGMSQKTVMIFLNMLIKSRCAVKTWFDAEAGDDITPVEGDPGYDKDDDSKVFKGQIRARVCDPMTIFYDPAATCEEEIRWVLERKARDVDELFEEYGKKVTPDAKLDSLNSYDITNINTDSISGSINTNHNMALTDELWLKPCKKYPGGVKITKAGGQELDYTEEAGELPYTIIGYIPLPGTMRFHSAVKSMRPVQRGINIKRSMIATHAKRVGNSMWTVPLGSGVDEEELSNEISGIVHYNAVNGMKPERVQAPDIPSFYDRDLANDANDLDDMSGAREVSQGSMPKGLDTLGGLQIMVEQENEKLTVGAMAYEEGMKKVMSRILRLVHKHYKEDRQAKIIGEDNEIEIITFNASDLTGDEDIQIVQGSSLPESKAAQEERLILLWEKGVFLRKDGTPDTDTFLRQMNMGDASQFYEQKHLDENKSKMENKFFEDLPDDPKAAQVYMQYVQQKQHAEALNAELQSQGQQQGVDVNPHLEPVPPAPKGVPVVRDFQDHEVHIFNHNSFRKCNEYDELPPEIQALVDAHVAEHMKMMQQPVDPNAQALQQENELKQQQLQLQQSKQEQDAQLAQAKLEADKQKTTVQLEHTKVIAANNNAHNFMSAAALAELGHAHNLEHSTHTSQLSHEQGKETSQMSHGQQMERDKQNNKNKVVTKK